MLQTRNIEQPVSSSVWGGPEQPKLIFDSWKLVFLLLMYAVRWHLVNVESTWTGTWSYWDNHTRFRSVCRKLLTYTHTMQLILQTHADQAWIQLRHLFVSAEILVAWIYGCYQLDDFSSFTWCYITGIFNWSSRNEYFEHLLIISQSDTRMCSPPALEHW
jgi:hypothetical protein